MRIYQLDFVYETNYSPDEKEMTVRVLAISYIAAFTKGREKLGYEIDRIISVKVTELDEVDDER